MEEAVAFVENEIKELKKKISKKEEEIENIQHKTSKGHQKEDESSENINLKRELEKLQAEVRIRKERNVEGLPNNSGVWLAAARKHLDASVEQLKMTIKMVAKERKEAQGKVKRLQHLIGLDEKVVESLEKKLKDLEETEAQTRKSKQKEMYEKLQKMQEFIQKLSSQMCEFLCEHFPPPSEDDINQKTKGLNNYQSYDVSKLKTMVAIVEELVQKWIADEGNPYVPVEDRMWPPYLELLLQYGIAVRHPENIHLIKLEDFRSVFL